MMRWAPAFPAWISIALMGVCALALWYVSQWPEDEPRWRILSLAGHALALSSFVAAWITATTLWRVSNAVAVAHAGLIGILGTLLYFPIATRVGDDMGVLAVWFTFNCLALAGWWIGTATKAFAATA